nr:hypothetical protein [Methanobrevibacter arboriphilus]
MKMEHYKLLILLGILIIFFGLLSSVSACPIINMTKRESDSRNIKLNQYKYKVSWENNNIDVNGVICLNSTGNIINPTKFINNTVINSSNSKLELLKCDFTNSTSDNALIRLNNS